MLKRVYRLQNSDGVGPYRAYDDYVFAWAGNQHRHKHRPAAWQDVGSFIKDSEVCAFTTFKGLTRWFTPRMLADLEDRGFRIVSALVPATEIARGKYQCVVPKGIEWYPVEVV